MKRELLTICLLTLLVAGVVALATPPAAEKPAGPSASDVRAMFEAGDVIFLDARSFEDYGRGHIPGAINIPAHDEDKMNLVFKLEDMLRSVPKIVVYCTGPGCELSDILRSDLLALDFEAERVILFEGGMEEWTASGYPVSTDTAFQESLLN